ncbi:MAG: methyltransferase domain-containing protein [Halobacteriovoraceae bacterium]|nr:methyltransferase domain-containing protein [Halobacteriovoraceae bacterium]
MNEAKFPYIHGFSQEEQDRLVRQARYGEQKVFQDIDFDDCKTILEVGCGVGAQTEILLRRFPDIKVYGIDFNETQLEMAKKRLALKPEYKGRYELHLIDACNMELDSNRFDGAFLCWVLEHVPEPKRALSEVRRVLKPGSRAYITEVMNSHFFLEPYSPHTWRCWMAFNDYQFDHAGDPFIGAKLGNLLSEVGFREINTEIKNWYFDNRCPVKRRKMIEHWSDLLLSNTQVLVDQQYLDQKTVDNAQEELKKVKNDPNAVYLDSFMQAVSVV